MESSIAAKKPYPVHEGHPATDSYVDGQYSERHREMELFHRGALGELLSPVLASDPTAARRMEMGWQTCAGLCLPSDDDAASWSEICRHAPMLDLSDFVIESKHTRVGGCDWKIFMEIYFDDYHVEPFHPGLSSMADCGALSWIWAPRGQAQVVGASALHGSGSYLYERFDSLSREVFGENAISAVWAAIYPNCMVEWLGGCLALSVAEPSSAGQSANQVAFAYPKGLAEACPRLVAAHQAAYWETAAEDDEIARRIQAGRNCLSRRGDHEEGPAHPHLEAGIVKFHKWLADELGAPAVFSLKR